MSPAQFRQLAATRLTSSSKSAWAERAEAALRDAADQLDARNTPQPPAPRPGLALESGEFIPAEQLYGGGMP